MESNWYVVTGGPSSGKSTVLAYFEKMGYRVIPEAARVLIDEEMAKGKTIEEIRRDEAEFQRRVLAIKVKIEEELSKGQIIFFDRAVPDSVAYYPTYGLDPKEALKVCQKGLYRKVFLMEQLPFVQDYARTEDSQTIERLNQLLKKVYEQLGCEVILVPALSVEERVKFVQAHLEKFRIGLFTSGWDQVAWDLVDEISHNFKVDFVLVTRKEEETHFGDLMIKNVRAAGLSLITFSSLGYKPWLRKSGRWLEKRFGLSFLMEFWRHLHDREIMKLLPPTDLIVLVGYMWWFGKVMCRKKIAINLHPAKPDGPKGNYREVIYQLIRERAAETGVMMHLVTKDLDKGPVITFCHFPIRGGDFDPPWEEMERRLEKESLGKIAEKEGEDNPLFKLIRRRGVIREFPMVIRTIKALDERRVRIENGQIVNTEGQVLTGGYDLTDEINAVVKEKLEREVS